MNLDLTNIWISFKAGKTYFIAETIDKIIAMVMNQKNNTNHLNGILTYIRLFENQHETPELTERLINFAKENYLRHE